MSHPVAQPVEHRRRPLTWRAEARRQWGRKRTRWVVGLVLVLPLILVGAFAVNGGSSGSGGGFVSVATRGGANFAMFTVLMSAQLLLPIFGAMLVGDAVPAEGAWSSLRYLLTAPVGRVRLLTSKLVVGLLSFAAVAALLALWAYAVGVVAYGTDGFVGPSGYSLPGGTFAGHALLALGYIVVTLLPVAAIAFYLGVRTDAPLGSVGGAFLVLVICEILDSITALGQWRNGLLGHYSFSYTVLFQNPPVDPTDMIHGALWSVVWTLAFGFLAYRHFTRKDVLS